MTALDLKVCDLLELSKMYAPEYNMPEMSDRVLVFDVMKDGWETSEVLATSGEPGEASSLNPTLDTEHLDETQSVKSEPEHPQISEPEEETTQNEAASSETESETKREPGSVLGEENKADSTEITPDNNNDDNVSSSQLNESFSELKESTLLRQHKIFVHSSWLAVQSKYFRSLFYSAGMKESNCKDVHVKISESEENGHLKLLEAIYKADILNEASVDELLVVLELADKYDVKFVFKKCKYVLQTRATSVDVCKTIMHVIKEKHRMVDVEDLAGTLRTTLGRCYSPLDANWQTERFTSLSQPCVKYLLGSYELSRQCENTIFQALMHWMETNNVDPSSIESSSTLLDAVRFELTTIDYLYNVIRVHPIATKMPHFQELLLKGMTYHALPAGLRQRLRQVTPVGRQVYHVNPILQYSWEIKSSELPANTVQVLKSQVFLCCGYKCQLIFKKENRSVQLNVYPGLILLAVLELTNYNYVPLTWSLTSYGFNEGAVNATYQFTLNSTNGISVNLKSSQPRSFSLICNPLTIEVKVQAL